MVNEVCLPDFILVMQEEKPFRKRYKWWLKGVSLVCGLLLIGLGGESFGTLAMRSPTDIILPVYYMYVSF